MKRDGGGELAERAARARVLWRECACVCSVRCVYALWRAVSCVCAPRTVL